VILDNNSGFQLKLGSDKAWGSTGISTWTIAFLLYIAVLPKSIEDSAEVVLFADATSVIVNSPNQIKFENLVNKVFQDIITWFTTNLLSLNVDKTPFMQFVTKTSTLLDLNIVH
jgi:hypothetical protein